MTDCILFFNNLEIPFTSIKDLHAFIYYNGNPKVTYQYQYRRYGGMDTRTVYYQDDKWKVDAGDFLVYTLNPDGSYCKKTTDDSGAKWYYTLNGLKLKSSVPRTSANIARRDGYNRSFLKGTVDTDIIEIWKVYQGKHRLVGVLDKVHGKWAYRDLIENRWYWLDVVTGRIKDMR